MFKLTMHFKHETIRIWQRFYKKFELCDLTEFEFSVPDRNQGFPFFRIDKFDKHFEKRTGMWNLLEILDTKLSFDC